MAQNKIFRIRHAMLRVRDLEKSIDFYTRVLNMELMRRRENPDRKISAAYVGYGDETSSPALELTHYWDQNDPYEMGTGFGHIAIAVPDLSELYEKLKKDGVKILEPPRIQRPGKKNIVAFITDPDGYTLELNERH